MQTLSNPFTTGAALNECRRPEDEGTLPGFIPLIEATTFLYRSLLPATITFGPLDDYFPCRLTYRGSTPTGVSRLRAGHSGGTPLFTPVELPLANITHDRAFKLRANLAHGVILKKLALCEVDFVLIRAGEPVFASRKATVKAGLDTRILIYEQQFVLFETGYLDLPSGLVALVVDPQPIYEDVILCQLTKHFMKCKREW